MIEALSLARELLAELRQLRRAVTDLTRELALHRASA